MTDLRAQLLELKHNSPLPNQLGWLRLYAEFLETAVADGRGQLAEIHLKKIEDLLPRIKGNINHERLYGCLQNRSEP